MDDTEISKLLVLIHRVVNEPGMSWSEKRDAIMANASDDEKTDLAEFVAWFE